MNIKNIFKDHALLNMQMKFPKFNRKLVVLRMNMKEDAKF